MKEISEILKELPKRKAPRGIHSELHEIIDKMRQDFGETAIKGVGSFSYYLGMLKKVPLQTIYQWLGSIRQSDNLNTPTARAKVFWWYYKKWKVSRETKLSTGLSLGD